MKATPQKTPFIPIVLTLESQEEVDKLFALLNHVKLQKALNWLNIEEVLSPHKSSGYADYHTALRAVIKEGN